MRFSVAFCGALWVLTACAGLAALMPSALAAPSDVCRVHAQAEERRSGIPDGLLGAIALAETGRWDDAARESRAWPWTVMARGEGTYHPSKQAALAHVAQLRAEGVTNIDVGCMQVNLGYHGHRFASVADAIDPVRNIAYAASFLMEKRNQAETWLEAASHYHSMTPHLAARYRKKVERLWAAAADGDDPVADTWGATVATAAQTAPAYVQPSASVNTTLMDRLNQSFRARRDSGRAQPNSPAPGAVRASDQVLAWRQARAAEGSGAPVLHDLYSDGGGEPMVGVRNGATGDGGPMSGLNAANAAQIAALIRRVEARERERAALRDTGRTQQSFAQKRRQDLAHWRARFGLEGADG
jgi:hypothetical protein